MLEIKEEYKNIDIIKIATEHYIERFKGDPVEIDYEDEYNRIKNMEDIPDEIYIVLYKLYEKAVEEKVKLKVQVKTIDDILARKGLFIFKVSPKIKQEFFDFGLATKNKENKYKVLIEIDTEKEELFKKYLDDICIKQDIFFINSDEKIIYKYQEK